MTRAIRHGHGHLRGPVSLTPTCIAERLAVELSLPVFPTYSTDQTQPNRKRTQSGPQSELRPEAGADQERTQSEPLKRIPITEADT